MGVGDVPSVPSLALGSGEVTLMSMTAAYGAFANQGLLPVPHLSRARFLPYTTRSAIPQSPWLVRLYLAVRPVWWIMGQQTWFVARKPKP